MTTPDARESDRTPAGVGYTIRWRQEGYSGEITGHVVYGGLDEVRDLCKRVNARWQGDIEQWPVEWNVDEHGVRIGEAGDLRRLVGVRGAHKRRES